MTINGINRRQFLKTSGGLIVGTLVFASGPLALLAPSRTWALELKALDTDTGQALLRFTRHLFPHDTLEDAVYALVVKDLDAEAAADAQTKALLAEGVAALDKAAGGNWLELPADQQFEIVKSLEASPFFQKIRGKAVVSLYSNPLAYAHFGYEGSSFDKGGYLARGFNDLTWLPDPPIEASPTMN